MSQLHIVDSPELGGEIAASRIIAAFHQAVSPQANGPEAGTFVLGLATGSTPASTWRALARRREEIDLSRMTAFALDEYLDIADDHPERYQAVIEREVTAPLGLRGEQVRVPGDCGKDTMAPQRYEEAIRRAGGIDLQVLGIGRNGHIAFNEPGSPWDSRCRITELSAQTRRDNARFFDAPDQVPAYCITQGIGTILEAREVLLLAYGSAKADALRAALEGPATTSVPASALRSHPRVTVIADRAAAAQLSTPWGDHSSHCPVAEYS